MPVESKAPDSINEKDMAVVVRKVDAKQKTLGSSSNFKNLVKKVVRSSSMKNLFKPRKPRTPVDVVRETRALLLCLDAAGHTEGPKHDETLMKLDVLIGEMKSILYGVGESEPVPEACLQLTKEFFKDDTLLVLIFCIPKLNLEARKDATQVVANLQRQRVNSRLIASDFLEVNLDLLDKLITGCDDPDIVLHYGVIIREFIRHQIVARYILNSEHMKKFFDYMQHTNFDVSSVAASTFKELMTRHKSTVAEYLMENYVWVCFVHNKSNHDSGKFNSKLLESTNYITRRNSVKLLGDILLDRSNSSVMIRYVSSLENMMVLMNLLRESHKNIQIAAFHVFKLFVANQNKPVEIVNILVANKSKLLRFFDGFCLEKEDETFEADKALVVKEIEELQPTTSNTRSGELSKPRAE